MDEVAKGRLAVRALLAERAALPRARGATRSSRGCSARPSAPPSGKPLARLALAELARAIDGAGGRPRARRLGGLAEGWLALGDPARRRARGARAERAAALGQAEKAAALRLRAGGLLFQSGAYAQADRLLSGVADYLRGRRVPREAGLLRRASRGQALAREYLDHQIGGAVHDLRALQETRRGIDEAAEPYDPDDLVEIPERGFELRQQVDGAGARALLPTSIETPSPSLPLATSLPSAPSDICPETNSSEPVRTNGT